jgi:DNA-directed RNA polymerase specialized sigma24 family protein
MDPYQQMLNNWLRANYDHQEARFPDRLLRPVLSVTRGDWEDAEDALQEAFRRLWNSGAEQRDRLLADPMAVTPYLIVIARCIAIDNYRRQRLHDVLPEGLLDDGEQPMCCPPELAEVLFEELVPGLDRITNLDQIVAVVRHLGRRVETMNALLQGYLLRRINQVWEGRAEGTRRADLNRGLEVVRCWFRERGQDNR